MNEAATQTLLYEAHDYPIFQNRMYESAASARRCPKGNIELVQNHDTGLIHNRAFDPTRMAYDCNYQNEQGVSAIFQEHLNTVMDIVRDTIGGGSIVEVGCGKGFFLDMLLTTGLDVTGFDPTYEGDSQHIHKRYYDSCTSLFADGIVLRHVLEHVRNPVEFLDSLRSSNGGKGLIYIEVPCFDWIVRNKAWFDIFYEHVNYFRLSDFQRMFNRIIRCGHLFGGQYLYVVADLSSLTCPVATRQDRVTLPSDFTAALTTVGNAPSVIPAAVWGGASKGVIFALLRERIGKPVDMIIDVNPAKQGLYVAGTGLQVKAPQDALRMLPEQSTIFVMNSNYLSEIKEMSNYAYHYVGVDNV